MEVQGIYEGLPVRLILDEAERSVTVEGESDSFSVPITRGIHVATTQTSLDVAQHSFAFPVGFQQSPTLVELTQFAAAIRSLAAAGLSPADPPQPSAPLSRQPSAPLSRQTMAQTRSNAEYRFAAMAAYPVRNFGVVSALLSAIGGFFLAINRADCAPLCDELGIEEYPNFWEGIAIGVIGVNSSLAFAMVAAYIRARSIEASGR